MSTKTICFASAKGGTGKTVTAASIAKLLGALKKRVLLIDVDVATNGLTLFYLRNVVDVKKRKKEEHAAAKGIFECSEDQLPTPCKLDDYTELIPAAYSIPREASSEKVFKEMLSKTIRTYASKQGPDRCDYILLDAQAGSDSYARIAIENADETIIVTEYDPVSIEGVERLKVLFSDIMPYEKTWILFNKVIPQFANRLRGSLGVFRHLSPIHLDYKVILAMANRKLALDTEKGNVYTLAIMETVSSLLGEEIQKDIDNWKQQRAENLRKPVEDQMVEAEKQINAIEKSISDQTYRVENERRRAQRFIMNILPVFVVSVSLVIAVGTQLVVETNILITGLGIAISSCFVAIVIGYNSILRTSLKKDRDLISEIKILDRKLEESMENYSKLRTLARSSLEAVMKATEEQPMSED